MTLLRGLKAVVVVHASAPTDRFARYEKQFDQAAASCKLEPLET